MAVLDWILDHWGTCLFIIGAFIQFTPAIKLNPLEWLGNKINGKLLSRIVEIENNVDNNEKDRIRYEIFEFANSCRKYDKHTKDEFEHIVKLHDKYIHLLEKTHDTNGVFTEEYNYIVNLYHNCQINNSFV